MNTEIWKPVAGHEQYYEVSNLGNVKSLYGKHRILKFYKNPKGYLVVTLSNQGARKTVKVHRLVAMAFIPNPENHPEVHHRIAKTDNRPEALSWVSHRENNTHAKRQKPKSSRFSGVSRRGQRWEAKIWINGRHKALGVFDAETEAHRSYLRALNDHGITNRFAGMIVSKAEGFTPQVLTQ